MKSILEALKTKRPETPASFEIFKNTIVEKSFKRGEILQKTGDVTRTCYFVKKGVLRSYVVDKKGKEHIYMFAPEGWIMGDIEAQTNGTPNDLYIDVVEDAELELFDRDIFMNNPDYEKENFRLLAKRCAVLQKRVIMLLSTQAIDRYHHFLETYPCVVQRIPQKMIASYLGITPEALSKIRSSIPRNEKI